MTGNKITFWSFIQKNKIEIPIIQRDYAQGRLGKEYLRQGFRFQRKTARIPEPCGWESGREGVAAGAQ